MTYDLIILGGEPLARAAARAASRCGLWTALVEPEQGQQPYPDPARDRRAWLVDEYRGHPQFRSPRQIEINEHGARQTLTAERILIATGARADTLALDRVGLLPDENGKIWCDGAGRTWTEGIFAVGAVVGFPTEVQSLSDMDTFVRRTFGSRILKTRTRLAC